MIPLYVLCLGKLSHTHTGAGFLALCYCSWTSHSYRKTKGKKKTLSHTHTCTDTPFLLKMAIFAHMVLCFWYVDLCILELVSVIALLITLQVSLIIFPHSAILRVW